MIYSVRNSIAAKKDRNHNCSQKIKVISNGVYIYEDEFYKNFLPLVYLRPVCDLYCGRLSLYEKIKSLYPKENIGLLVRPILAEKTREKYPDLKVNDNISNETSLFISARTILKQKIDVAGKEEVFTNKDNEIIGFRVKKNRITDRIDRIYKKGVITDKIILSWRLPKRQVNAISLKYLWDIIEINSNELINDFPGPRNLGKINDQAFILGDTKKLYLGRDAEIEAGAVIDLRQGPVYIDDNVKILALSKIVGPAYIGNNSIIDQAKITDGTTIGANCRVSGEVESSIFQGFVNKHHYGFIGHSYIGEWVNLGAGTTNSDLKNNYSSVKVQIGNKEINTGKIKVGSFIGDHAKTAIGTMIPTGAVIGIFANVLEVATETRRTQRKNLRDAESSSAPRPVRKGRNIPNFYWSKGKRWQLEKVIKTARIVMSRRNVMLTKNQEALINKIYKAK